MPPLPDDAWARIRYAYEHTAEPVDDICLAYGITANTLRLRARRWGWTMRRRPIAPAGPAAAEPPDILPVRPRDSGDPAFANAATEQPHRLNAAAPMLSPTPRPDQDSPAAASRIEPPDASALGHRFRGDERFTDHAATAAPAPPTDPAAIAGRLQSAAAQVLPAIEAAIARLASAPQRPREMEQAARALGTLMRTLRELNALRGALPPQAADDDPVPDNIDAVRAELARRIHALVASERDREQAALAGRVEAAWLGLGEETGAGGA